MKLLISLVVLISAFAVQGVTSQETWPWECTSCPPVDECTPTPCPEPTTVGPCPTTWYPVTCPECDSITCPTCEPTFCPTPTQSPTTQRPTCPPAPEITTPPTFSKTFYTTSVPSWPTSGTRVHPGIAASTDEGDLLVFSLVDPPSFIQLVNEDLLFTNDVTEGAYVGPNNVLALEVEAKVYTDERRSSRSVILVVFPRPTKSADEFLVPTEIKY